VAVERDVVPSAAAVPAAARARITTIIAVEPPPEDSLGMRLRLLEELGDHAEVDGRADDGDLDRRPRWRGPRAS
jgi:hypothetical protein